MRTNSPYKRAVCRGSMVLGTACGSCEKCDEERARRTPAPTREAASTQREEPTASSLLASYADPRCTCNVREQADTCGMACPVHALAALREGFAHTVDSLTDAARSSLDSSGESSR